MPFAIDRVQRPLAQRGPPALAQWVPLALAQWVPLALPVLHGSASTGGASDTLHL
ncbi:MAG: hypothetical protein P8J37_13035 [Fuerstiella sp.]|nr:hypothetical protein [Fuerstiella sp.]